MPPPNYDEMLAQWRFKGLNEGEHNVAMKWLRAKGMHYDRIDWNVALGPTPPWDESWTVEQRAQADYLYSTKADIVAWFENAVTIVEVKVRATKGALGQLAHYRYWFLKQNPSVKDASTMVIAEWSDPGIAETLLAHGVGLELYGEPS
jgi:hypothetical protein